jgi:hypothetical protein
MNTIIDVPVKVPKVNKLEVEKLSVVTLFDSNLSESEKLSPALDDRTMLSQLSITMVTPSLDIVSNDTVPKMINKRGGFPVFELLNGNISDLPLLISDVIDYVSEVHSRDVMFLTDMRCSDSPINNTSVSDSGTGICFVVFSTVEDGKIYLSTDKNKHDYCVDYNKIHDPKSGLNLITAGKILGRDSDNKVHLTNKSGSYHRWIQAENKDEEFNKCVNESENVVMNLYAEYIR